MGPMRFQNILLSNKSRKFMVILCWRSRCCECPNMKRGKRRVGPIKILKLILTSYTSTSCSPLKKENISQTDTETIPKLEWQTATMEKFASSPLTDQKCNPNQMVVLLLRLDVVTKSLQEQGIGFLFISIYMVRVAVLSNLWLWPQKGHHVLLHSGVELSVEVFIFLKIIGLSSTTLHPSFYQFILQLSALTFNKIQRMNKISHLFMHFRE